MDKLFRPYQGRMHVAMELPSVAMIKRFVAAGLGVSLICGSFASHERAAGSLKIIPLAGVQLVRELALVYRRERVLPRAAMAFIDLVLDRMLSSSDSACAV